MQKGGHIGFGGLQTELEVRYLPPELENEVIQYAQAFAKVLAIRMGR
jgi:hypothetical protein